MTPLQRAKAALVGTDVECAIGRDYPDGFKGYPGLYRIVGLTARTVIVASYTIGGEVHPYRKTSIRIAEGRSGGRDEVYTRMRPSCLARVRGVFSQNSI